MTINACKDLLRSVFRRQRVALHEAAELPARPEEHRAVLQAVQSLRAAYRDVVYLHYYEGYTAPRTCTDSGQKCEYHLHTADPRPRAAAGSAGR